MCLSAADCLPHQVSTWKSRPQPMPIWAPIAATARPTPQAPSYTRTAITWRWSQLMPPRSITTCCRRLRRHRTIPRRRCRTMHPLPMLYPMLRIASRIAACRVVMHSSMHSSMQSTSADDDEGTSNGCVWCSPLKEESDFRNERDVVPAGIRTGPNPQKNLN